MPAFEDKLPDDSEAKAIADTMPHLQHIELCFGRFGDSDVSEILAKCKALTDRSKTPNHRFKSNGKMKDSSTVRLDTDSPPNETVGLRYPTEDTDTPLGLRCRV
ncbi:hypothetical protein HanHA300_Chr08g0295321 [Helianthus annuus]|nr:hypothetical protein HanHA300_Chr08g0295321 [Helianthus annuus]KAJ0554928.1 hypothetical protein HanHA89_Chr08g0313831 [Helianthus annuus]KAJ0720495.1 hypothetical protein HanLR1_Chr08g0294181 [Helianthus annuus]